VKSQYQDSNFLARVQEQIFDYVLAKFELPEMSMAKHHILFIKEVVRYVSIIANHEGSKVFFSPGRACLDTISQAIASATKSIDVCVFTISDDRIASALQRQHARRVSVRILSDNDKIFDLGSDIQRLSKIGIPVRLDRGQGHMHHKFAVFDHKTVLTGSYNWTRSAETSNNENIIVTVESSVVKAFEEEFDLLWSQSVALQ